MNAIMPAIAGLLFLTLGTVKVYGMVRGIEGGCKPALTRACGSCSSWSRTFNVAFVVVLLMAGFGNLYLAWATL